MPGTLERLARGLALGHRGGDSALPGALRKHDAQVDTEPDQRLGDLCADAGQDEPRSEKLDRLTSAQKQGRDRSIHRGDPGDIEDDRLSPRSTMPVSKVSITRCRQSPADLRTNG